MNKMIDVLLLILGLAIVLIGANYLVEGAGTIAKKAGMSDFMVGMTIVGIGTSTPEMVVSFIGALNGNADVAVGNVMGSNLFNTMVILGVSAIITPIALTSNNIKKDIPFCVLASLVVMTLGLGTVLDNAAHNTITRVNGIMLLAMFGIFIAYSIFSGKSSTTKEEIPSQTPGKKEKSILLCIAMFIGGLVGLIFGGDMFVNSACSIAKNLGLSDTIIALTILAGGTSLPELATSVMAAYKKNTDMAFGNVIGSNISNIFLILGGAAVIHPLSMDNISLLDLSMLVMSSIIVFVCAFTFKKRQLDRSEGIIMTLGYIAYITYLVCNA